MLGVGGWKTITGVIFYAISATIPQMQEMIDPVLYQWLMIVCGFAGTVLTGLGIAHKIEKGADRIAAAKTAGAPVPAPSAGVAKTGQSGLVNTAVLVLLLAIGAAVAGLLTVACTARQSAMAQVSAQTSDPGTIALATFADAQDAYIDALELYQPYQQALIKSNPELNAQIVAYFTAANKILMAWQRDGSVPVNDEAAFRGYLRTISIRAAQALEAD